MNNKYVFVLVGGLLIVVGIYFFTNKNSNSTPSPVSDTTSNPKPVTVQIPSPVIHNISIVNFGFSPASITVRKGETIVWTNKDKTPHTVTGGDLKSNPLAENQTYSFVYEKTGTFSYHCSLHPSMKGTITVTN